MDKAEEVASRLQSEEKLAVSIKEEESLDQYQAANQLELRFRERAVAHEHDQRVRPIAQRVRRGAQRARQIRRGVAALHDSALTPGALDTKTKELIAFAIAGSECCDGCIAAHAHAAVRHGATTQEAAEAIGVAILMTGGPGTIYGPRGFAAFQEFHAAAHPDGETVTE